TYFAASNKISRRLADGCLKGAAQRSYFICRFLSIHRFKRPGNDEALAHQRTVFLLSIVNSLRFYAIISKLLQKCLVFWLFKPRHNTLRHAPTNALYRLELIYRRAFYTLK